MIAGLVASRIAQFRASGEPISHSVKSNNELLEAA
jgi:hypothetical protein